MPVLRDGFFAANSSAAGGSLTATGVGAGNSVVIGIAWYSATVTITGVTIASNSNPTLRGTTQTGGPDNARIAWYVLDNVTTAGDLLVSYTLSAGVNSKLLVWDLSGTDTAGAVDGTPAGGSGTTANPSVNATTSVANAAIFAILVNNTANPTAGAAYTQENTGTHATWYEAAEYDIDAGAAGTNAVDWTVGASTWVMHTIAIKPAAAPPPPPPSSSYYLGSDLYF